MRIPSGIAVAHSIEQGPWNTPCRAPVLRPWKAPRLPQIARQQKLLEMTVSHCDDLAEPGRELLRSVIKQTKTLN